MKRLNKILILIGAALLFIACQEKAPQKLDLVIEYNTDSLLTEQQAECLSNLDKVRVNAENWEHLKAHLYRNKHNDSVYHLTCSLEGLVFHPVSFQVDIASFKNLGIYAKDKNRVYYHYLTTQGFEFLIFKPADVATFQAFGSTGYGKDKKHVFYARKGIIKNADPRSFELLSFEFENSDVRFAQDKNRLYIWGTELQDTSQVKGLTEYLVGR